MNKLQDFATQVYLGSVDTKHGLVSALIILGTLLGRHKTLFKTPGWIYAYSIIRSATITGHPNSDIWASLAVFWC
jgi:hypothetical protein